MGLAELFELGQVTHELPHEWRSRTSQESLLVPRNRPSFGHPAHFDRAGHFS